ncbi:MAG TPA: ABC transporter permease [Gemmatimonadaceae bacterium]|nr:ABC transporter permease [Gemmatimonadaceae bacterium]
MTTLVSGAPLAPPAPAAPTLLRRLGARPSAVAALSVLAVLAAGALLAPWIAARLHATAPLDPMSAGSRLLAPSLAHPFGTDAQGRDVLAQLLLGGRVSLAVAAVSTLIAAFLGTAVGVVAGHLGGRTDALLMRGVDTFLAMPRILVLIALFALWPTAPVSGLALVIGAMSWFGLSRVVRAQTLAVRVRDHVAAARALGAGELHVLLRHVLPNVAGVALVAATLVAGEVVGIEAGLSFLGLGVRPPDTSWGKMVQDGVSFLASAWWIAVVPALAIALTVAAISHLGDVLRDLVDVRQLPPR